MFLQLTAFIMLKNYLQFRHELFQPQLVTFTYYKAPELFLQLLLRCLELVWLLTFLFFKAFN